MHELHLCLHAVAAGIEPAEGVVVGGRRLAALRVPEGWARAMLPITFDEAVARLDAHPRTYVEADGSFVWTGNGGQWRIEGQLHDRGARLSHVELKVRCPAKELARLVAVLGLDPAGTMFQIVREGIFLDAQAAATLVDACFSP